MSPEREMVVEAVLSGVLSEEYITDDELVEVQITVMDLVIAQKMKEGKIVFDGVINGMLN